MFFHISIYSYTVYFQPHENNSFNSGEGVALNEDEYRYVLNDTSEYNNIIPQYLENDVNDFMFSSEPQIASNPVEYYNGGSNSNYAITNLDANAQNYSTTNNANTFDSAMYERYGIPFDFSRFLFLRRLFLYYMIVNVSKICV